MSSEPDTEIKLADLVRRMARSINLACASYEIWFAMAGNSEACQEFSSEMRDHRYTDFFSATIAAHRNIVFIEIACLFDPDKRAASFFKLKRFLSTLDRDSDAHMIDAELKPYRDLVANVREVRHKGVAHHDIAWPEERYFKEDAIVPDDTGRLLVCCNGLIKNQFSEAVRAGVAYPVVRPGRFEDATYALLDVIRDGRS